MLSFVDGLHVERSVEHGDEQSGVVSGRGMPHRLSGREMTVCPRTDDLVVDLESAFENHHGVGSCVPMFAGRETGRVPDEVVLLPRTWILMQEPQADLPIVDDGLRPSQLHGPETIDDDCPTVFHAET